MYVLVGAAIFQNYLTKLRVKHITECFDKALAKLSGKKLQWNRSEMSWKFPTVEISLIVFVISANFTCKGLFYRVYSTETKTLWILFKMVYFRLAFICAALHRKCISRGSHRKCSIKTGVLKNFGSLQLY